MQQNQFIYTAENTIFRIHVNTDNDNSFSLLLPFKCIDTDIQCLRYFILPGTTIYQNNRNNRNTGITTEIPEWPTIYRNNEEKYQNSHYYQTLYNKIHEKWIITLILFVYLLIETCAI